MSINNKDILIWMLVYQAIYWQSSAWNSGQKFTVCLNIFDFDQTNVQTEFPCNHAFILNIITIIGYYFLNKLQTELFNQFVISMFYCLFQALHHLRNFNLVRQEDKWPINFQHYLWPDLAKGSYVLYICTFYYTYWSEILNAVYLKKL